MDMKIILKYQDGKTLDRQRFNFRMTELQAAVVIVHLR